MTYGLWPIALRRLFFTSVNVENNLSPWLLIIGSVIDIFVERLKHLERSIAQRFLQPSGVRSYTSSRFVIVAISWLYRRELHKLVSERQLKDLRIRFNKMSSTPSQICWGEWSKLRRKKQTIHGQQNMHSICCRILQEIIHDAIENLDARWVTCT